jgi:Prolyl oligopeptidase family.
MIIIDKKPVCGIPLLEVAEDKKFDAPLPLVFFVHGFTSAKENNLHYAFLLAERGFRVVLPEAMYHGERSKGLPEKELAFHFTHIVLQTIHELEILKNEYLKARKISEGRIGVAGLSMGGIVTLGALARYPWIRAAVSLMGSPALEAFTRQLVEEYQKTGNTLPYSDEQLEKEFAKLADYDLSRQPEKLHQRPLLFWHGKKDPVVPYRHAWEFYEKVKDSYRGTPDRLQFILDPQAEHKVTRDGVLQTVAWFDRHLGLSHMDGANVSNS